MKIKLQGLEGWASFMLGTLYEIPNHGGEYGENMGSNLNILHEG